MSGGRKETHKGLGLLEHIFPLMMLDEWYDLLPPMVETLKGWIRYIKNKSILLYQRTML